MFAFVVLGQMKRATEQGEYPAKVCRSWMNLWKSPTLEDISAISPMKRTDGQGWERSSTHVMIFFW